MGRAPRDSSGLFQKLPAYFRRAGKEITFGISTFGAASPSALNCCGLRNIAQQPEQA